MSKKGDAKILEAFLLEKLLSGGFEIIASIPPGKSMAFDFPAFSVRVENRGTHYQLDHCSRSHGLVLGSMKVTSKNLIRSVAPLIGRTAGSATSSAKTNAARMNGKKGGRPRKQSTPAGA